MQISFSPVRSDAALVVTKVGEILTVNGEAFDFSDICEGDILPRAAVTCGWLASDVTRVDGMLRLALILPHRKNAPLEVLFPEAIIIHNDGVVALPSSLSEEEFL